MGMGFLAYEQLPKGLLHGRKVGNTALRDGVRKWRVKSHNYEGTWKGMILSLLGENRNAFILSEWDKRFPWRTQGEPAHTVHVVWIVQLELNHFLHEPVPAGPWFIGQDVMTNITADSTGGVRCGSSIINSGLNQMSSLSHTHLPTLPGDAICNQ